MASDSAPALMIDKTIKKIKFVLTLCGINIKYNKTQRDKYRSWFIYYFNFIWLNIDATGAYVWLLDGIMKNKSFTVLTFVAPCAILGTLSSMKTIFMVINESTFDLLIANIRKLETKQKERDENEDTERIMLVEHNLLNKTIRILGIFYFFLVLSFALSPLLLMYVKYRRTNEVELALPFLIIYPFDPYDMRYYPWVYLHQIGSDIIALYGLLATDFMFYIFCTYLRTQFHLLCHYIENIMPDDEELNLIEDAEGINIKLAELINWHQQIISSVEQLDTLFTKSTLFNYISSSLLICFSGFNVMAMDNMAYLPTFIAFLLINLLQIFFQCYFGDRLMRASMDVGDAIYNSRWYLADLRLRKTMLQVLLRAQLPCKLTAYKFAEVNMNAFMKIGSTSWSYFALLRTMYTGPAE